MSNRILLVVALFLLPLTVSCSSNANNDRAFDDPDEYVKYGNGFLRQKKPDFKMAAKQFGYALDLDSDHYEALIGLGDASMYMAKAIQDARSRNQQRTRGGPTSPPPAQDGRSEQDRKKEKQITQLLKRAALSYAKARDQKPEAALPYFKQGRLLFEFRNRAPEELNRAKKLLSRALKRTPEDKPTALRAQILYYLGGTCLYLQRIKPEGKRSYDEAKKYLHQYLDLFADTEENAPRQRTIENLLMEIEEYEEGTNESSPVLESRDTGSDPDQRRTGTSSESK